MFRHRTLLAACAALLAFGPAARADEPAQPAKKPKVEVVFVLDTTGSMGGLIEGAKRKIWAICNQIANGKPTPELKVGLVAFRDKGDAYITKVYDLNDDLDTIYAHLKEFKAQGGGDIPESVNQALDDAVTKIKWSTDKDTLRIIFLVGDAPPHMDYTDDVKYPVTCKKACEKAIIINTVQCGNDAECTRYWKDICKLAEGSYVQIPQDGGVQPVVSTPFDKRLTEINSELAKSTLVYGDKEKKADGAAKNQAAERLAPAEAAPRAAYQAKNRQASAYDLLDCVKQGKVKLEDVKKDELPEVMQKMTLAEQTKFLEDLGAKREALLKEAVDLDKKRTQYIADEQAKKTEKKDSFDDQVLDILRKQARGKKIEY
jgi:Mg-chelatase subunit ChlD